MDGTDEFFTQTIVGAPLSVLLGERVPLGKSGVQVELESGSARLVGLWQEWALLGRRQDTLGRPRHIPGRVQMWLERHALLVAGVGLACLGAAGFLVGGRHWL